MLFLPWMEHTRFTNTLKRMFCGVPPSDLSRNMDIAHRGVLKNLRCKAVFTTEIGQYSGIELLSRRSQIMRLCNMTPFLFKYLHKTPYYREILDRNIESEMYFCCWWVSPVSDCAINQGNFRITREMICKNILYVWFLHFTLTEAHRCLNIFPVVVFQYKKGFSMKSVLTGYRQPKPSLLIGLW